MKNNPVAKNAHKFNKRAAGPHKDKKKASKRGERKHKGRAFEEVRESRIFSENQGMVSYEEYCDLLDYIAENYDRINNLTLKEDWWSSLTPGEQDQYIKDHPESDKAKNAKQQADSPDASKKDTDSKAKDSKEPKDKTKTQQALQDLKTHVDSVAKSVGADAKLVAKAFKEPSVYNTINGLGGSISAASKSVVGAARSIGKGLEVGGAIISDTKAFKQLEKGVIKVDEFMSKHPALKKVAGATVAGIATYQWLTMSFSGDIEGDYDVTNILDGLSGKATFSDLINTPDGVKSMGLLGAGMATGGMPIWMGGPAGLGLALAYTGAKKAGDTETGKKVKAKMLEMAKSAKQGIQKKAKSADAKLGLANEGRNYKKEYENYHSRPDQKKKRAARNGARRMLKDRKDIKGKDVHHKDNNPLNNDKSNLSIVSQHYNRKEPRMRKEALGPDANVKDYIDDFQKSDAPQFKGKDEKKRKEMAIAAYLDAKRGKKEEVTEWSCSRTERTRLVKGGDKRKKYMKEKLRREAEMEEKNKGLWDNIHAKRKRGEKPAKPGEKGYPKTLEVEAKDDPCWDSHKQVGMKKKGGKEVPNCVPKEAMTTQQRKVIGVAKDAKRREKTSNQNMVKKTVQRAQVTNNQNAQKKAAQKEKQQKAAQQMKKDNKVTEGRSAQDRLDARAAKLGLGKPNKAADDYLAKMMKKYGAKDMADLKKKMGMKESTAAYGKSQSNIRRKQKHAGISASDKDKLGKLSALMKSQKKEGVNENFRTLATKGMGAEKKSDIKVGTFVDYFSKENGDKHSGNIVKMGPRTYDVKDEKTGKVHTFNYYDPAKARKLMKEGFLDKKPKKPSGLAKHLNAPSKTVSHKAPTAKKMNISTSKPVTNAKPKPLNSSMDPRDFTDKAGFLVVVKDRKGNEEIKRFFNTKPAAQKYVKRVHAGPDKATIYKTDGRKMMKESNLHELTQRELDMMADRKQKNLVKRGKAKAEPKSAGRSKNVGRGTDDSSDNLVMQLRKAQDLNGKHDIKFKGGKTKLPKQMIDKLLKTYDKLRTPADKKRFETLVTHELRKKEGLAPQRSQTAADKAQAKFNKSRERGIPAPKGKGRKGPSDKELRDIERGM